MARRAVHAHQLRKYLDHPTGADAAGHVDRQAFARELIDDGQTLQDPPIGAGVEHKIVRPDLIRPRGRERPGPAGGHPTTRPALRHLETGQAPEAIRPFRAHRVTGPAQEDPNLPVAIAGILSGEVAHRDHDGRIPSGELGDVRHGRAGDREQGARAAARQTA